jgi:hypothetical protein
MAASGLFQSVKYLKALNNHCVFVQDVLDQLQAICKWCVQSVEFDFSRLDYVVGWKRRGTPNSVWFTCPWAHPVGASVADVGE